MTQAATTEPELDPRSPRVRLAAFFDDGEFTTITPEDDRGVLAAVGRANGTHVVACGTPVAHDCARVSPASTPSGACSPP
jgi:hypothetical protein